MLTNSSKSKMLNCLNAIRRRKREKIFFKNRSCRYPKTGKMCLCVKKNKKRVKQTRIALYLKHIRAKKLMHLIQTGRPVKLLKNRKNFYKYFIKNVKRPKHNRKVKAPSILTKHSNKSKLLRLNIQVKKALLKKEKMNRRQKGAKNIPVEFSSLMKDILCMKKYSNSW